MEANKVEFAAVKEAAQSNEIIVELTELDLVLVGGGSGAVSLG